MKMKYRDFGKTGVKVSRLGFGAMRLPEKKVNDGLELDMEAAVKIMQSGFESGINYVDTAYFYHDGKSEVAVGKAIKGWREKVMLSTKSPGHLVKKPGDYRRFLEEQLTRLQEDCIDFYHFHGISYDGFLEIDKNTGWLADAQQAKAEGLIKRICFSFHSTPEDLIKLVDLGHFESVLCQYNLLDRSNEKAIAYAHEKGLGVIVMGPVGGGKIAGLPKEVKKELNLPFENNIEMAFRFVLANPNIDCALSGMGSHQMVDENLEYANIETALSNKEVDQINSLTEKLRKMADLYCTSCKYCLPCPAEIQIPDIFDLFNYHKVYGLKEYAVDTYSQYGIGQWFPKVKADECTDCGECEERCPQNIEIRAQLIEAHKILTDKSI
jgi:uncharacterized protein